MEFNLDISLEILAVTPAILRNLLGNMDDEWILNNYGENTFSPFDVIGHFIHGERTDWITRAQIIILHGETRPFDPFDRYAQFEDSKGKTIGELLDTFETLRQENINTLRELNLTKNMLDRKGAHPELGAVTLRQLLSTWTVHDLHHIAQICKGMAYQYKNNVGAWSEYIGILPRE